MDTKSRRKYVKMYSERVLEIVRERRIAPHEARAQASADISKKWAEEFGPGVPESWHPEGAMKSE